MKTWRAEEVHTVVHQYEIRASTRSEARAVAADPQAHRDKIEFMGHFTKKVGAVRVKEMVCAEQPTDGGGE